MESLLDAYTRIQSTGKVNSPRMLQTSIATSFDPCQTLKSLFFGEGSWRSDSNGWFADFSSASMDDGCYLKKVTGGGGKSSEEGTFLRSARSLLFLCY